METAELSHHKPGRKICLGLCTSFLGNTGAGGHGRPVVRPRKVADVHGDRWTVRLGF